MGRADLIFTAGLFGTIMLLVLPVPSMVMDMLLALSIASSLLIMLVVIYVRQPVEFSAFPTVLLGLTLFRLALNICSTRLVLTRGEAGHIIEAFGKIVIQGNYVVGFVVFVILVVINFVVITKGAGRIAEVSARFTLDALPGKQMAIDADLNAGLIDEKEAMRRQRPHGRVRATQIGDVGTNTQFGAFYFKYWLDRLERLMRQRGGQGPFDGGSPGVSDEDLPPD
jgi:flagellar biosynthesis protein FlhA